MSTNLADTYYLKALDYYPYDLENVIEALNYAISYDDSHAGANCLLGKLNVYQLGNYSKAEAYFEKALAGDINHTETHYSYADLLIQVGEYLRAKKLIKYSYKVKGINVSRLKYNEGLISEISGDLEKAKNYMTFALSRSFNKSEREFLSEALERINSKIKSEDESKTK
ncbi:MAG: hypothetical protein IPM56_18185 [Ignavibacteriales bacterium]|nr:MAG: hypothetical protein IPM56_18185 [Ignavibacteriales bacterium]